MTDTHKQLQRAENVIIDLTGLSAALDILAHDQGPVVMSDPDDRKWREAIIGISDAITRVIEAHSRGDG